MEGIKTPIGEVGDIIKWIVIAIVCIAVIAAGLYVKHKIDTGADNRKGEQEAKDDMDASHAAAKALGMSDGRLATLEGLARNIYKEMRSTLWVTNSVVVSLCNQCATPDEMIYLAKYYTNNVSEPKGAYNLKADIDNHCSSSTGDINFYSALAPPPGADTTTT